MKKQKRDRLGISIVSNIFAMVVSLGVSFLLTPFLINHLGKDAYSFFPLANNFIGYMNIISIALNSMASRFITISLASGKKEESKGYFSTVFYSNMILCGILLIPMLIIIAFLDRFLDIPLVLVKDVRLLFVLMFVSLLIQLIFSVFGVATFAKERMDLYAYQNIGLNALRAGLYVGLFTILPTSIVIMGIVTILLAIYTGVVQLIYTKKLLPDYTINRTLFNRRYVRELLSSGVWNSVNSIGSSLLQTMMLLMANMLISASASGDLSIVQTLPNLMTTIISTIYGVLLPRIANVYAQGNEVNTIETVKLSQKILGAVSSVPVVIIILLGRSFFSLWVPSEDADYLQMLSVATILPLLIHSSMWMVYGLNLMNNKVRIPALSFLGVGVINIIITIIVMRFTDAGLIAIPLISAILNMLYYVFFIPSYAAKEMGFAWNTFYSHIVKTIIFASISCAIGIPVLSGIVINSWIKFFAFAIGVGVIDEILYCYIVLEKRDRRKVLDYLKVTFTRK